jgi:hypothetical protein
VTGPLRICIGYDAKEPLALQVLAHSIVTRASGPVSIIPIARAHLTGIYTRPRGANEATEFSLTRFLAPYLCGYEGIGLFLDSDILCRTDMYNVLAQVEAQPGKAVWVAQHDYTPKPGAKFLGQAQTSYPMKNWSSVMVFDAAKCKKLTPDYVNTATGLELHRFQWLRGGVVPGVDIVSGPSCTPSESWEPESEREHIGSLPLTWNWLVGEYEPNPDAKLYHYTLGTPCFQGYRSCDHADLWWAEHTAMQQPMDQTWWGREAVLERVRATR